MTKTDMKPDKEDRAAMRDLDRFLKRYKLSAAKEIRQLFRFLLLGEAIDPDVLQRWRQIGVLTKDNKLLVTSDCREDMGAELISMSSAYIGLVKLDPVPIPEAKSN